jgi:hypothetical protein
MWAATTPAIGTTTVEALMPCRNVKKLRCEIGAFFMPARHAPAAQAG